MPNEASIELRSAKPSLLMRAVKWVIKHRKPIFPQRAADVPGALYGRKTPRDAPLPDKFEQRFRIERWEAAGQQVITIHPKAGPGEWHMLYFHGGGFVLPMAKEHWPMIGALVRQCNMSITVPLYALVPEVEYSAQDALADTAFAKIAATHDPAKIILNGDSAGGHMALCLALRLAKSGGAQPGKLALFAPWLDMTMQDPAMEPIEPDDVILKIGALRALGTIFAGDRDPKGPQCSPLYAAPEDLALLPPTRIWTGGHDLFIVDSRTFTGTLRGAGVDAKLYEYAGAPHVFMLVVPTRESKDALRLFREFLAE